MKDLVQYVICSNQWFSAVTEYAFQLAIFLKSEGYIVQVRAHHESPLLRKADQSNLYCAPMKLKSKSVRDWLGSVAAIFMFLWSLPKNQRSVLWVVEGHEHTVCALVRLCFPQLRKRTLLVRLRGQDRFRRLRSFEQLVLKATDFVVFPSLYAARKLFPEVEINQKLFGKVLVQHFCKNFGVGAPSKPGAQETTRLERILETKLSGLGLVSNGARLNFVSIARFDKVKGLERLIEDFVSSDFGDQPSRLLLVGRAEALTARDLAEVAAKALGKNTSVYSKNNSYFVEGKEASKQVFIFDEFFENLSELLSCCQFAVISSLGSEVICRTAVECLQLALPIVSTDVGSLKETLGNFAAIYAPASGEAPFGSDLGSCSFTKSLERASEIFRSFNRYAEMCEAAQAQGRKYFLANYAPLAQAVFETRAN